MLVAVLSRPPDVDVRQLEVVIEDVLTRPLKLGTNGTLSLVVGDG